MKRCHARVDRLRTAAHGPVAYRLRILPNEPARAATADRGAMGTARVAIVCHRWRGTKVGGGCARPARFRRTARGGADRFWLAGEPVAEEGGVALVPADRFHDDGGSG